MSSMDLVTWCRANSFLDRASPALLRAESENNLPLGVAAQVAAAADGPRAFFATVERGSDVIGTLVWTPPHRMLLSLLGELDASRVAEGLAARGLAPAGVHARTDVATAFASTFSARTGRAARVDHAERLYEATDVASPAGVPGGLRCANENDQSVLGAWVRSFLVEAGLGEVSPDRGRAMAAQRIARGELFVWEDRVLVAMAALTRPTPSGVAVNFVFTPPEQRGRGYAKACVAALTHRELARGRRAVCLNADLANPISNQVYRRIGFQAVVDLLAIDFA